MALRSPEVLVGEQIISNPASKMGLLSPTSSVASASFGSMLESSVRRASLGIRERELSCCRVAEVGKSNPSIVWLRIRCFLCLK